MRHRFRKAQWLPYPVEVVFAFFSDPSNLPKLMPEWQDARIEEIELHPAAPTSREYRGGVAAGRGTSMRLSFRPAPFSPIRTSWLALIEDFHWNERFCDRQIDGPFRYWRHCHRLQSWEADTTGEEGTLLIDMVEYELPIRRFGEVANKLVVRPMLERVFRFRHRRTEELLREVSVREESLA